MFSKDLGRLSTHAFANPCKCLFTFQPVLLGVTQDTALVTAPHSVGFTACHRQLFLSYRPIPIGAPVRRHI
jgi:hypothetical protein